MSTSGLTQFSYVVLVLVGKGGAGPHDLLQMAKRGRVYWSAADSQWYSEPKRLEKLGYLSSDKRPGRTRERTHYMLTDQGLDALQRWMEEPTGYPRMQLEPVLRLLAADIVGEEATLESLRALRAELNDLNARLDVAEQAAGELPHRRRYLLLNHRLARALVQAHSDWLDEVERELG